MCFGTMATPKAPLMSARKLAVGVLSVITTVRESLAVTLSMYCSPCTTPVDAPGPCRS